LTKRHTVNSLRPASLNAIRGLSEEDAQKRLRVEGYNELPRAEKRMPLRIMFEVLSEPMLALLLGGGLIYLALGDLKEALILIAFAMLSIVITIVQESRTERVLEALRDLTSPRALVIRDGERKRIAGREVARGDIVVIEEGDRVPADMLLLQAHDLRTDESLLTGESVSVRKRSVSPGETASGLRPGGDGLPFAYSGTMSVGGSAIGEVTATGVKSEIGKIGLSLCTLEIEPPRLRAQIQKLVWIFSGIGAVACVATAVLFALWRGTWLEGLLAGIALGMAMLPEEFPVVMTIFMAMGAWRISQARVLTRRAAAIETLGSATVLCTDKTGTLTLNKMSVAELRRIKGRETHFHVGSPANIPAALRSLVEGGLLASSRDPFDPMDKAFHELADQKMEVQQLARVKGWRLERTYGLRPDLLAVTQVWNASGRKGELLVAAKGAPEAIASLCRLSDADRQLMNAAVNQMAEEGLRVLGVARAVFSGKSLPKSPKSFAFEFVGLVGLRDPLRPGVPEAVAQSRSAGIRVIMITGDYPATAKAIALQAGIHCENVVTGDDLAGLDDPALATLLKTATVFARIMPEQKLRIVNALKSDGEIVAMTGDGVNDAPSLKAAHIGVAMGGRGTDVAREASSIVLLDDDFGSIVKAVRLGRRIFDNLQKAMGFIVAVHVPIAGLALLPLVTGLPILFGPVHIAFLEMIIDPVCTLVYEAESEEGDIMARPPRAPDAPLFSRYLIAWSVVQGAFVLLLVAGIYIGALHFGMPEAEARALVFFSMVLSTIGLVFVNRSFSVSPLVSITRPNRALLRVMLAVAGMLALTIVWPLMMNLFRFGPLHLDDLTLAAGAGVVVLLALASLKRIMRIDGKDHGAALRSLRR
jgi:P-type Ca2+ transporter type 2C